MHFFVVQQFHFWCQHNALDRTRLNISVYCKRYWEWCLAQLCFDRLFPWSYCPEGTKVNITVLIRLHEVKPFVCLHLLVFWWDLPLLDYAVAAIQQGVVLNTSLDPLQAHHMFNPMWVKSQPRLSDAGPTHDLMLRCRHEFQLEPVRLLIHLQGWISHPRPPMCWWYGRVVDKHANCGIYG